jgi:hypothetical protein
VSIPRYATPRGNKDGAGKKEKNDSAHGTNKKYRPGEWSLGKELQKDATMLYAVAAE